MHDSFDDWLATAQETEQYLKAQGLVIKRVIVDPDKLVGWCAVRGLEPIGKVRAEYVAEKARAARTWKISRPS
jgi:hypothetical protein